MIEINLLPEALRKKKGKPLNLPKLPAFPVLVGIIGLFIVLQIILVFVAQAKKATFSSLNKKLTSISTSSEEAKRMEDELKTISAKITTVEQLSALRLAWAKKLNDLSDSLISGIWLRSIYLKKTETTDPSAKPKRILMVEGASIISGEKEQGYVGEFVNSLKANKEFSGDFYEIELVKVERRKIRNTEVIDFIVACHFKEGRGL